MDETPNITPNKEICTMRILFPIESDEQAFEVKSKISAIVTGIKDVQVHFSILPTPPTMGNLREPQIR